MDEVQTMKALCPIAIYIYRRACITYYLRVLRGSVV
jgi:hypothetical protein